MNIRGDLVNILNEKADAVGKLVAKRDELERDIQSGRFSAAAVADMRDKLQDVRASISNAKDETRRAVAQLVNQHVAELEKADALNPDELNEADVKLLNSGLPLTKRDLSVMLERNQGNRTMTQAVLRWAKAHDVDMDVAYLDNEKAIADAKQLPGVVGLWIDHWSDTADAKTMIDKMFGTMGA